MNIYRLGNIAGCLPTERSSEILLEQTDSLVQLNSGLLELSSLKMSTNKVLPCNSLVQTDVFSFVRSYGKSSSSQI